MCKVSAANLAVLMSLTGKRNTTMTKQVATYYTLIARDNSASPWAAHFGDYDLDTVQDELAEWHYLGHKLGDLRIVKTNDLQSEIDDMVAAYNA